ncbi:MAG: transposase [Saccharofermentanales bacterium]
MAMGRKPRNYHKGGIYHIYQRGNNRAYIFNDRYDKAMLLAIIKETMDKYPCFFLYYVLMDNHYHLMIEMIDDELGVVMRDINRCYSKYYNKKYDRIGTIFGDRYKSQIVSDTRYFLKLLHYMANNPVKADLVRHPSQYRWSAHCEMISKQARRIDREKLLSYIGVSLPDAQKTYLETIEGDDGYLTQPGTSQV